MLLAAGAWEVVTPASPAQLQLVNVAEEMAIAAGLPKPTVWVVPDQDLNAFATGHDPRHASIAVTEGLLAALDRDELQGVVAHEMAHIQNDDVKLMTLLAGMLGAIALLSDALGRYLRLGGRVGGASRGGGGRGGKGGNPLGAVLLVLWLLTLLIAPVVSRLLAMAVSRKREYLADATAAQFTRHPEALARALEKLDAAAGADAQHRAGGGAPVHRGSGGAADQRPGGDRGGCLRLAPADPAAGGPPPGDGVPAGQAGGGRRAGLGR